MRFYEVGVMKTLGLILFIFLSMLLGVLGYLKSVLFLSLSHVVATHIGPTVRPFSELWLSYFAIMDVIFLNRALS